MIRLLLPQAFLEVLVGFSWGWEGLTFAGVTLFFLNRIVKCTSYSVLVLLALRFKLGGVSYTVLQAPTEKLSPQKLNCMKLCVNRLRKDCSAVYWMVSFQ